MVKIEQVEFWMSQFKPRTKAWQKSTLRDLKKSKNPFETEEARLEKIRALEILLKKR